MKRERREEREGNDLCRFRYVNAEERGGKEALMVAGAAAVGAPLILSGFLIQLRSVTGCFLATALCTSVPSLLSLSLSLSHSFSHTLSHTHSLLCLSSCFSLGFFTLKDTNPPDIHSL
jgi:hypothetical protein